MSMREIKFRAWDKSEEHMVEVFQTTFPPVSDLVLMQFTGLLDKNGKEIYEGDVLEQLFEEPLEELTPEQARTIGIVDERTQRVVVEWNEKLCGFQLAAAWCSRSVVIGNIYENPDLLK